MAKDIQIYLDALMDRDGLWANEGQRGVKNLCQITRALGYKDPNYFGQLSSNASIGDLILFLEDNPGAITAILEWVAEQNSPEMLESLSQVVGVEDEDEGEDEGEDE